MQADLFDPPVDRRCGTCVVYCELPPDGQEGDCSRHGRRGLNDTACAQWFGLGELNKALYGRAAWRTK